MKVLFTATLLALNFFQQRHDTTVSAQTSDRSNIPHQRIRDNDEVGPPLMYHHEEFETNHFHGFKRIQSQTHLFPL